MGDFFLYHKGRLPEAKIPLAALARQGSKKPITADHDSYGVYFFPKQLSEIQNFIMMKNGDFCGTSGSFIYKGQMGKTALCAVMNDFHPEKYQPQDFNGIFTLIVKKHNRLYLLTDPMGASRVYHNDQHSFWSSSFLAAASTASGLSANKQAVYEYAFQETTYGPDTVFREVSTLDSLKNFEFTPDGPIARDKSLKFDFCPGTASLRDLVDETVQLLRDTIRPVSKIFGNKIRTALSGGYDSRLMLALLKDCDTTPGIYVYGPGDSPDVMVARTIAAGEDFPLDHIDKGSYPLPGIQDYPGIVEDNFYGLDGLPNEGIFDFGANMDTRRTRSGDGHMIFNGGGGEIFRNFFYLPKSGLLGGDFTITDLINSFYSRYSNDFCQDCFDEQQYRDALHDKIRTALMVGTDRLDRGQVEYLYPAFRLRYWTARDNNNNSRLGPYLTPFISYAIIKKALTIPLEYKNHGIFQAELIKAISPRLAAYMSDYGYAFDRQVPAKAKFRNYLTYYRPPALRRYSYALQHHMGKLTRPRTLSPEYLTALFKDGQPHMSQYFKIDKIKDAALLGRVLTLEYLFNHFRV